MAHPLENIYAMHPVNAQAKRVTSQKHTQEIYKDSTFEELTDALNRLQKRRSEIKEILGLKTKTVKNLRGKYGAKIKADHENDKSLMLELLNAGDSIQWLNQQITRVKASDPERIARKKVGAMEQAWKEKNPVYKWDGEKLIASNGCIFNRSELVKQALLILLSGKQNGNGG